MLRLVCLIVLVLAGPGFAAPETSLIPPARQGAVPSMRWDHRPQGTLWTRATLAAIKSHGRGLVQTVPNDIETWCPGYAGADDETRAAFWVGLFSALAKHESTWRQGASGGGGRWIGLTQISPATARGYKCQARDVDGLMQGSANLSCAVRIAAFQVARDGALVGRAGKWRGVARDWAPFRNDAKRADMAAWTRKQSFCQ